MTDDTPKDDGLRGPDAELVLRYLKHRWPKAVADDVRADALPGELPWTELDLDPDVLELDRAIGRAKLERVALATLTGGALEDDAPAFAALAPELTGARARVFLRTVGANLALRLRTDALLVALLADAASGPAPRPSPALAAALVGRCRSRSQAQVLVERSPLAGERREAALGALGRHALPPGARLFADGELEAIERAFAQALRPLKPVEFGRAPTTARRFLLLRRRGGFLTALAEGDDLPLELALAVARQAGVRRVAWMRSVAGSPPELAVLEGPRLVLDGPTLAARLAAPPDDDEVCGALLALGVTELDPEHPRGARPLAFAAHLGSGPPLGVERKLRRANVHPLAFA